MWLFSFVIYKTLLSHVLFYADSHHLFLYEWQYLADTLRREGLGGLATDFIVQFFHDKTTGAAVLASMLAVIYLIPSLLLISVSGRCRKRLVSRICQMLFFCQIPLAVTILLFFSFQKSTDTPLAIFTAFIVASAGAALLRPAGREYGRRSWLSAFALCLVAAAFFAVTVVVFRKNYDIPERMMLKTEQFAEEEDWDSVLEYSAAYFRSGRRNRLIAYYRSMALAEKGELLATVVRARSGTAGPEDRYLMEMGENALFFPWESNSRESEFGSMVYERTGLINEAQRWETEAMQVFGITGPHLVRLAKYAITTGRPDVADHFIEHLRHTLNWRREALWLEDIKHDADGPGIADAFRNSRADDRLPSPFSNVISLAHQLEYALECNPDNAIAAEYLEACRLLPKFRK